MIGLSLDAKKKMDLQKNIWVASVRPDGRPHLVPVWFALYDGKVYICIEAESVKGRNLQANPSVILALEDGSHPVICEGSATFLNQPYPASVALMFQHKYDWDITGEAQYNALVEVSPHRWLVW